MSTNPTTKVCIYHRACPDGVASAWVVRRYAQLKSEEVFCYGAADRDFDKDTNMPDLTGKEVYIVDYSYPRPVLTRIAAKAKSLVILDHHKTAMDDLTNYPNAIFDLSRCAAEITWDYFFPCQPRPWFIQHIRDRDLWLWEDPNSKFFGSAFFNDGLRFEVLDAYLGLDLPGVQALYQRGKTLIEFDQHKVQILCSHAEPVTFEGHDAWLVNTPLYTSEVGNELIKTKNVDVAVIVSYILADKVTGQSCWRVSLRRGDKSTIDLSAYAKKYGGGGHPAACGFSWFGNLRDLITPRRVEENK
jgi:oligoribonuclease NrnB/cAMP/cGMP phosphodiesterase (DHH superfamily)